jgi:hypothetical protein
LRPGCALGFGVSSGSSVMSRKFADKFDGINYEKPSASGAKSPLHFRKNVPQGLKAS